MSECYGDYFILNGELSPCGMFKNSDVYEGDSLYEVIRMMGGVPLFVNDHIDRLENSVSHHGRKMLADRTSVIRLIMNLRKSADVKEANLKIVFNYKEGADKYLIYFIEPMYPSRKQYREGIAGILFHAERKNPEVKVINHSLRSSIYHRLIAGNAYEAFLVDSEGYITEGSRSNIFFVRENRLYTAPDEKVLGGITRKFILELCRDNSIEVVKCQVKVDEISNYESAFMSGTSPMVLPIREIDGIRFDPENILIKRVSKLYSDKVHESIRSFRPPKE
jgi:branched-chain amino acid aminotransferase